MLKLNTLSGFGSGVSGGGGPGGYFMGYYGTVVDKMVFSTEVTSLSATATLATTTGFATPNLSDKTLACYLLGGGEPSIDTGQKLTFASDTTANVAAADLSQDRRMLGSVSDGTYGWMAGGYSNTPSPAAYMTTGDKITFSTDTTSASASTDLSTAAGSPGSVSEGSTHGYLLGGYTSADGGTRLDTGRKITFSNDTTALCAAADLSRSVNSPRGLSDQSTNGYMMGGQSDAEIHSETDKIVFSTDTASNCATADLATGGKTQGGSFSNAGTYGYHAAGEAAAGGTTRACDRLVYATDTTAALASGDISGNRRPDGASAVAI